MLMTPMDWTAAAIRVNAHMYQAQMNLGRVLWEATIAQQKRVLGLAHPMTAVGICGPVPLNGAKPVAKPSPKPRAAARPKPATQTKAKAVAVPAKSRSRKAPSKPPAMPDPEDSDVPV